MVPIVPVVPIVSVVSVVSALLLIFAFCLIPFAFKQLRLLSHIAYAAVCWLSGI